MVEVKLEGLEGVLKTLESLPKEMVSKGAGNPVASSARAALKPMAQEARENLARIVAEPNVGGVEGESTGLLEKNIKVSRRRPPAGQKGERFAVRVIRKTYPNAKGGKKRGSRTTVKVGALLEYGTEKMTPKPWIRPAYEKHRRGALTIFVTEINKKLARLIKKLERQNGVA